MNESGAQRRAGLGDFSGSLRVNRSRMFGMGLAAVDVRHRRGEQDDLRSETDERPDRAFEVREVHADSAGNRGSRIGGLDREAAGLRLLDEVLAEEPAASDYQDVGQRPPDASADSNPFAVEGFSKTAAFRRGG